MTTTTTTTMTMTTTRQSDYLSRMVDRVFQKHVLGFLDDAPQDVIALLRVGKRVAAMVRAETYYGVLVHVNAGRRILRPTFDRWNLLLIRREYKYAWMLEGDWDHDADDAFVVRAHLTYPGTDNVARQIRARCHAQMCRLQGRYATTVRLDYTHGYNALKREPRSDNVEAMDELDLYMVDVPSDVGASFTPMEVDAKSDYDFDWVARLLARMGYRNQPVHRQEFITLMMCGHFPATEWTAFERALMRDWSPDERLQSLLTIPGCARAIRLGSMNVVGILRTNNALVHDFSEVMVLELTPTDCSDWYWSSLKTFVHWLGERMPRDLRDTLTLHDLLRACPLDDPTDATNPFVRHLRQWSESANASWPVYLHYVWLTMSAESLKPRKGTSVRVASKWILDERQRAFGHVRSVEASCMRRTHIANNEHDKALALFTASKYTSPTSRLRGIETTPATCVRQ
jgi:hypothetical protein